MISATSIEITDSVRIRVPYGSPNFSASQSACRTILNAQYNIIIKIKKVDESTAKLFKLEGVKF